VKITVNRLWATDKRAIAFIYAEERMECVYFIGKLDAPIGYDGDLDHRTHRDDAIRCAAPPNHLPGWHEG
jgi:hypothetical protein